MNIFISYAHENRRWVGLDKDWRFDLLPWLQRSLQKDDVELWFDKDRKAGLGPGDPFRKVIEDRIDDSELAILLVTQEFLNSEFVQTVEMPRIVERAKHGEIGMIPILLEPCAWDEDETMGAHHMIPGEPTPLVNYTVNEPDWLRARKEILDAVRRRVRERRAKGGTPATSRRSQPRQGWTARPTTKRAAKHHRGWAIAAVVAVAAIAAAAVAGVWGMPGCGSNPGPGAAATSPPSAIRVTVNMVNPGQSPVSLRTSGPVSVYKLETSGDVSLMRETYQIVQCDGRATDAGLVEIEPGEHVLIATIPLSYLRALETGEWDIGMAFTRGDGTTCTSGDMPFTKEALAENALPANTNPLPANPSK